MSRALTTSLLLATLAPAQQDSRDGRPNVVIVFTDDQGYGDL